MATDGGHQVIDRTADRGSHEGNSADEFLPEHHSLDRR